jgi:hypothetical protein
MPIEGESLEAVSRKFCDKLNRLLAKTISEQRIVFIGLREQGAVIGFRQAGIPTTAKLRTRFGEMLLSVGLLCGAARIRQNWFRLFVSEYRYTLTPKESDDPLWRWEYVKNWPRETDRWCRHHVQGDVPIAIGRIRTSLNDLHLPTGYVTLEEVIRFCLTDLRVRPLSRDWHDILQRSYDEFKREPYS